MNTTGQNSEEIKACIILIEPLSQKEREALSHNLAQMEMGIRIQDLSGKPIFPDTLDISSTRDLFILDPQKPLGAALLAAFQVALETGYSHALTTRTTDISNIERVSKWLKNLKIESDCLIIASSIPQVGSNFIEGNLKERALRVLVQLYTGFKVSEPSSTLRVYPLREIIDAQPNPTRQDFMLETLVKAGWNNTSIESIEIEQEQSTQKSPFLSYSIVHTIKNTLVHLLYITLSIIYFVPKRLFFKDGLMVTIKSELTRKESIGAKAASISFGLLMSVTPIWGFQSIVGLPVILFFRLNKVLFLLFVNMSIPPLIPFIVYASFRLGSLFMDSEGIPQGKIADFSMETIELNFAQYALGSLILSLIVGVTGFVTTYCILRWKRGIGT